MFQTDQPTAASSLPVPATAGTPGYFTNGNPASGVPATILDADFMNMLMMELSNVVTGAGIALSKTTYNQVLSAIKRIGQNTVVLADTGAANAYAAANSTPLVSGTWVDGVVQQIKIAHVNTGASTYAPDGLGAIPIYGLGLQPLQGGELAVGGTAVLMRATITGVNSGNPICVLMECAGGAQQVAPAVSSQHAAQLGQVSGVVGHARNLSMSVTAASATATLTADEIVVETALGGLRYCLANFNKTINLAATGAGGMDTGSAPAPGFVGIYAIYNPTTGSSALLATNATAAKVPEVYAGGHMPSGYTASALVSVVPTNVAAQFPILNQFDRQVDVVQVGLLGSSTDGGTVWNAIGISGLAPKNAKTFKGYATGSNGNAGAFNLGIGGDVNGTGTLTANFSANGCSCQAAGVPIMTTQTIYWYYHFSGTVSSLSFQLYGTGYTF